MDLGGSGSGLDWPPPLKFHSRAHEPFVVAAKGMGILRPAWRDRSSAAAFGPTVAPLRFDQLHLPRKGVLIVAELGLVVARYHRTRVRLLNTRPR